MRLLDRRAVAGGGGGPAARPHPGAVHRGHAGGRPYDPSVRRAGGHRDRHAAPAAPGQSGRALGAGQPGRRVPVHEDDDVGRPAALPARRRYRSDRRFRCGRPGPAGRAGDAHGGPSGRHSVTGPELRHLPWTQPRWDREADVLVVGSGAAGLTAALTAAGHGRSVLLLSKEDIGGGATPLAQGGLAAAIGPGDDPELHQRDTLEAGGGGAGPGGPAPPGELPALGGTTGGCIGGTRWGRALACAIRPPWPRWYPGPGARSPGWPGVVPGWIENRSTWRAGTAASES